MKNFNVVVQNQEKMKEISVKVESHDDFIEWFKVFSSFKEEDEEITYEEICLEREEF